MASLLWTGWFPSCGPERISATAGMGATGYLQSGTARLPAAVLQLALCYNLSLGRQRLSPMLSGTAVWGWDASLPLGMSAMAGVVWAPTRHEDHSTAR
jgi:hypothetical protein